MKILIADDSKAMRMIVVRTMRQAGFNGHDVIEAENGREGLQIAQSQDPDLILSDWNMPEMTGIEFLRALRASGSAIPFCFVTSEGSEEMRAQAEQAGALGLIAKPFTAELFADTLAPGGVLMSNLVEHSPMPSRHAVRNLIEDLIGRDVQLSDGLPPQNKSTNVVAVYVTDKLAVSALAVVDIEGAARMGGALAMVPKGGVDDAIHERELTSALEDNAYEVLNVLAAVFNVPGAPHVKLYEMYKPGSIIPADIAALAGNAGNRMDVQLNIAGYGAGQLSIITR